MPLALAARLPRFAWHLLRNRRGLPGQLRNLLTELGPAYAKLGQVLSTRSDALPEPYVRELARLRDRMPPAPPQDIRRVLRQAFPDGVDEVFSELTAVPFAAGTVAQVHRGRLRTGEAVAVKILRPGVADQLRGNFAVLTVVAGIAQRFSTVLRVLDVHGMARQLRELLLSQTDLEEEARNYRRFAREFAGDDTVVVPKVFSALSGPQVLVTEFVDGIGPYETHRLEASPAALALRVDDLVDNMIFVVGLCHADLHPGNFFWNARGQLVLVDLGLVHQLTDEERNHLLAFYSAILDGFNGFAADYFLRHFTTVAESRGTGGRDIPPAAFTEIRQTVHKHWVESDGKPAFSAMFFDMSTALGRNGLRLKPDYSKLFLTLVTVEGYLYSLDPEFNTLENARRKRVQRAQYAALSAPAHELVFGDVVTYSTALFGAGDTAAQAYANRDAFVLDALGVGPQTFLVDVGCGRGHLLRAAVDRGATALGITISAAESQACTDSGLSCIRSSWENFDQHHGHAYGKADAIAAIELDTHFATLYENRVGLLDLRLTRFFGWARSRLHDDGRMFMQSLSIPEALLHDTGHRFAYDRVADSVPWLGFSTLPQLIRCADPFFSVERVLDHSTDLLPTYAVWRANINRHLHQLRPLVGADVLTHLRRQLDTLIWLAENDLLQLYRLVFTVRAGSPPGARP